MAAVISVLLVEDQTLVRQGIRSLLALVPHISIAGEAHDGEQALAMVPRLRPDVVLLDLKLPGLDGIEVLRRLQWQAAPPVLVLTTFDDTGLLLAAIRAGARGYLLKDVSLEQLLEAITVLGNGGTMITPALTARVLDGRAALPAQPEALHPGNPLTGRETEILRLLASGLSNREIAHAFDLADGTVKNHVSNLLGKLGVRDRTRAVLKGLELGWF